MALLPPLRLRRAVLAPLLSLLLLLLAAAAPAHAFVRPPPGVNNVYLRMQIISLSNVDGVSQTFAVDFFLLSMYAAPNPDSTGLSCPNVTHCDTLGVASISKFWQPRLEFINSATNFLALTDEPYSFAPDPPFDLTEVLGAGYTLPDGWVWILMDQRYSGTFSTELNMNAFPMDIQHLEMLLQSGWPESVVRLVYPEATPAGIEQVTSVMTENLGWDYLASAMTNYKYHYPYNNRTFHRFAFTTSWKRQPQYYLSKIVAGTMLLVWMCIWNFSLQIDEPDRMMGTLQVFTGLISFLFVASGDTPKLPYQTRLDVFMLFSFVLVSFMMFLHGLLYYFREQGFQGDKEAKLNALEKKKRREFLDKMRRGKGGAAHLTAKQKRNMVTPIDGAEAGSPGAAYRAGSVGGEGGLASPSAAAAAAASTGSVEMVEPQQGDSPANAAGPRGTPRSAFTDAAAAAGERKSDSPDVKMAVHPAAGAGATAATGSSGHMRAGSSVHMRTGSTGAFPSGSALLDGEESDSEHDGWEVRLNDWSTFSFSEWFAALACTRKWDAVLVPTMFLFYTIGSAVILGREHSDGQSA